MTDLTPQKMLDAIHEGMLEVRRQFAKDNPEKPIETKAAGQNRRVFRRSLWVR
jgi:hypothetical protein